MAAVGRTTGLPQPTLSRWRDGVHPSTDSIRVFANAYGRPVTEAYVAAGLLLPEEVDMPALADPRDLTTEELLGELGRRAGASSDESITPSTKGDGNTRKGGRVGPPRESPGQIDSVLQGRMDGVDRTPGLTKRKRDQLKRQLSTDFNGSD